MKKLAIWLAQAAAGAAQYLLLLSGTVITGSLGFSLLILCLIYLLPALIMLIVLLALRARRNDPLARNAAGAAIVFSSAVTVAVVSNVFAAHSFWEGVGTLAVLGVFCAVYGAIVPLVVSHVLLPKEKIKP